MIFNEVKLLYSQHILTGNGMLMFFTKLACWQVDKQLSSTAVVRKD